MKLQRMTWGRWVELLFGALPTLFWICCFSIYGVYFGGFLLWTYGMGSIPHPSGIPSFIGLAIALILGIVVAFVAIASLWITVLFGIEVINRHPFLRWSTIVSWILGIGLSFWIFFEEMLPMHKFNYDYLKTFVLFIGPASVGLKYFPKLLEGPTKGT